MPGKFKSLIYKLRFFSGLLLCAFIIFFIDPGATGALLLKTDIRIYLLAFIFYGLVIAGRAFRWQCLLLDLGIRSSLKKLMEVHLIGCYFNFFVPGGVAADVYKIYNITSSRAKTLRPFFATLIERITGIATLGAISFISALSVSDKLPEAWKLLSVMSGLLFICSVFALILMPFSKHILKSLYFLVPYKLHSRLPAEKLSMLDTLGEELRHNNMLYIRTFIISIALQFNVLLVYFLIGFSINPGLELWHVLVLFPLVDLTSMIPVTVNGLGVKEGLLVYFLSGNGMPSSFPISLAILCRLTEITFALCGGVLFSFRKNHAEIRTE